MRKLSILFLCGIVTAVTGCAYYPDYYYDTGYSYTYTEPAPKINIYHSYQHHHYEPVKIKHHSYKPHKPGPEKVKHHSDKHHYFKPRRK